MERNIESILSDLGFDYRLNDENIKKTFRSVATIQQGIEEDLCYCSFEGEEAVSLISKSHAGIILCKNSVESFMDQYYQRATEDKEQQQHLVLEQQQKQKEQQHQQLIFVDNPRAVFIKIINKIYNKNKKKVGISPTAIISKTATIGSDCYIGNYTVIGEDHDLLYSCCYIIFCCCCFYYHR